MGLLAGTLYDPVTAVTQTTTGNAAMKAFDTVNLRLSFVAPSSGNVVVRIACVGHGVTALPQVLFGVLDGSTVKARVPVMIGGANVAATTRFRLAANMLVTGLTPGTSYVWDAAYGVETPTVSATVLKYGGPDNTTANDAFGGIEYTIWSA